MNAVSIANKQSSGSFVLFGDALNKIEFGSLLNRMSDDDFEAFCLLNKDWRIERTKEGDIIIMPSVYTETGGKNFDIAVELGIWAKKDGSGKGFDSSTGYKLPNGATRSPDVSWIRLERWNALPPEKRRKFAQIAPDFMIELRSETDSLKELKKKMQEYIENGISQGWLIDPKNRRVYVYRPNHEPEVLDNPNEVSGESRLEGFVLNLKEIRS